jgi:3-methyladenine DNA glycosylase AlkD
MRALANPSALEGMARFGIDTSSALGLNVPTIRAIARRVGKDQVLAEQLWNSGIHEARTLASMVADPHKITRSTMDRWARDFDSWDVCDA